MAGFAHGSHFCDVARTLSTAYTNEGTKYKSPSVLALEVVIYHIHASNSDLHVRNLFCSNSRYVVIPQYFYQEYRGTIFANTAHP